MRVVHKFVLPKGPIDTNIVKLTEGAVIRRVGSQLGRLYLWVEYDPTAKQVERVFHVYGTGWEIVDGDEYVGTATVEDEHGYEYVWHVYERKN